MRTLTLTQHQLSRLTTAEPVLVQDVTILGPNAGSPMIGTLYRLRLTHSDYAAIRSGNRVQVNSLFIVEVANAPEQRNTRKVSFTQESAAPNTPPIHEVAMLSATAQALAATTAAMNSRDYHAQEARPQEANLQREDRRTKTDRHDDAVPRRVDVSTNHAQGMPTLRTGS